MIHAVVTGRLTADPVLKEGTYPGTRFSIASDRWKKDEKAIFVNCTASGKTGEFALQYLKKASKVCVYGTLETREYDKNGTTYTSIDLRVDHLESFDRPETKPEIVGKAKFEVKKDNSDTKLPFDLD